MNRFNPFHPRLTIHLFLSVVAVLWLGFSGGTAADAPGKPLSAAEIETALTNAASKGVNSYGNPYTVWFLPGGRLDGVAGVNDEYVDSGSWWLEDDYFCRRWNVWLGGVEGCFQVVIYEDTIYWLDHLDQIVREEEYIPPQ